MSLPIGYEGSGDPNSVGAKWVRIISDPSRDINDTRAQIRAAKAAGKKVILTVGAGPGERQRNLLGPKQALRFINQLPRADKYTWTNEPDISGRTAANYGRGWMELRKTLGNKLLWGDFSPHDPVGYTLAAQKAVHLPSHLQFAVHPYQLDDPLAPTKFTAWSGGAMGNLGKARQQLIHAHINPEYWLTEFGYATNQTAQWRRALQRARALKAKVLVAYDVKGPNWDTSLTDEDRRILRGG